MDAAELARAAALFLCFVAAAVVFFRARPDVPEEPRAWKKKRRDKPRKPAAERKADGPPPGASRSRWLLEDRYETVAAAGDGERTLRFATFNVLADQYAYGQRHRGPKVLDFSRRFDQTRGILERSGADVILLQEADRSDEWVAALEGLGYACAVASRGGASPDACVTAWRAPLELVGAPLVERFDDLVPEADALARRFKRRNVGLVVRLRDERGREFVIANAHLHWDPACPDVKLAQMWALLRAARRVAAGAPIIVGGDFNSLPESGVAIKLACEGFGRVPHAGDGSEGPRVERPDARGRADGVAKPPAPRILCDPNLNRLCRRLRILGVDAALATDGGAAALVSRAAAERRVLATTCKAAAARRDAAEVPVVVVEAGSDVDAAFRAVAEKARLDAVPESAALTRCVKCNGVIRELSEEDAASRRATAEGWVPSEGEIFACDGCGQLFWWGGSGRGSAARAKELCDSLRDAAAAARGSEHPESGAELLDRLRRGVEAGPALRSVAPRAEKNGRVSNYVPDFRGQLDYLLYVRCVDIPRTGRGDAAAATWKF